MGIGDIIQISSSALRAYQSQINVTGENIANVDTEGYSRRELPMEVAMDGRGNSLGVEAGDVTRCFNAMSSSALISEQSVLSFHTETVDLLGELEVFTGGASDGFSEALQEFDDAWSAVASNPEDIAERTVLLQKASSLATEFNQLSSRYSEFSESLVDSSASGDGLISGTVSDINDLTSRLQDINQNIYNANFTGRNVPALRDSRDLLVSELSAMANISVSPDYSIQLGGEELLSADGTSRQELVEPSSGAFSVGGVDISSQISGGSLAARVGAYQVVQSLSSQLDQLAQTLSTGVNTLFDSGYNLQGENPATLGYTFFTGTDASNIALDTALFDPANPMSSKPKLIAAAATRLSAGPPVIANSGDNTIANSICDLLDEAQSALGDRSAAEFWSDIETQLAGSISESADMAETSTQLVSLLDERAQSQSGVNLDEELVTLTSAQRAYEACAKVFSTASDMLDTLMNM